MTANYPSQRLSAILVTASFSEKAESPHCKYIYICVYIHTNMPNDLRNLFHFLEVWES